MIGLYCVGVIGTLLGAKFFCDNEYNETTEIPLRIREVILDEENERLDYDIAKLLEENKKLCKAASKRISQSLLVNDELQERFDVLERKIRQ